MFLFILYKTIVYLIESRSFSSKAAIKRVTQQRNVWLKDAETLSFIFLKKAEVSALKIRNINRRYSLHSRKQLLSLFYVIDNYYLHSDIIFTQKGIERKPMPEFLFNLKS